MVRQVMHNISRFTVVLAVVLLFIQCGKKEEAPAPSTRDTAQNNAVPQTEIAGEIFGVPVPVGNYYFAKRVHSIFQTPEERKMTPEEMEKNIWHNLTLSFEASRRTIEVTDQELDEWIDSVLNVLDLKITRKKDPDKYKEWVTGTLKESVELFENQMRYMANIEKLKREIIKEMQVTVSEEEMKEDYLNVQNHVGGEFILFDDKAAADAFYQSNHDQLKWEEYKKANAEKIKPFFLITLQAIIDLWGVPKEQIYAFHALPLGTVGEPMPFGNQWGVFRLQDKKTGDLTQFSSEKDKLKQRVEARKKYQASLDWLNNIDKEANIKVVPALQSPNTNQPT